MRKINTVSKMPSHKRFEDKKLLKKGFLIGIDEAGRGAIAGPLSITALTLLYPSFSFSGLPFLDLVKDSKELTPRQREKLYQEIIVSPFILFGHVFISNKVIDKKGINQAYFQGARKAVEKLFQTPFLSKEKYLIITDGKLSIPGLEPQLVEIKADKRYLVCALASIVSKVKRDRLMIKLGKKYPEYSFQKNKGYGTNEHILTLKKIGPTPYHRVSFLDSNL